jgi:hypothetical protein
MFYIQGNFIMAFAFLAWRICPAPEPFLPNLVADVVPATS